MESSRGKIIVVIIVLAIVIAVSTILPSLLSTNVRKSSNSEPWESPTSVIQSPSVQATKTSQIETKTKVVRSATAVPPTNPALSCIHSVIYWADHSDNWPKSVNINNLSYTRSEIIEVFDRPSEDLSANLLIQLHAAYLNLRNGARNNNVEKVVADAANWIVLHPVDNDIVDSSQQAGIDFETILIDFNNGKLGPGLCENETIYTSNKESLFSTAELPTETIVFTATYWPTRIPTRTKTPEPPPPRRPNPPTATRQPTLVPTQIPTAIPTKPVVVTATPEPILPTPAP